MEAPARKKANSRNPETDTGIPGVGELFRLHLNWLETFVAATRASKVKSCSII